MAEQICVIKNASLGYDIDAQCLTMTFDTYETECRAAGQRISGQALEQAFADTRAPDVSWFRGKACWCEVSGCQIVYLRMFKLHP